MKNKTTEPKKNALQLHLEQLFKKMRSQAPAPEVLKKEVFETIHIMEEEGDSKELHRTDL